MNRIILLLFTLFLSSLNINALGYEDVDTYSLVKEGCFDNLSEQKWFIGHCTHPNKHDDESYNTGPALNAFAHFATEMNYWSGELQGIIERSIVKKYTLLQGDLEGAVARNKIITLLNDALKKYKLDDCQKACLVKCSASKILSYAQCTKTKIGSNYSPYEIGKGVCTEYQEVAWDLGKSIGIDIGYAFGARHAFNEFKIEGKWYYGEPQNDSCQFFTRDLPVPPKKSKKIEDRHDTPTYNPIPIRGPTQHRMNILDNI